MPRVCIITMLSRPLETDIHMCQNAYQMLITGAYSGTAKERAVGVHGIAGKIEEYETSL